MNDADGKVIIETELNTKQFDYQIEYLQRKLDDMIADYTTMSQEANFDEQSYDAIELRKNIEKVSNQIVGYKKRLQEVGNESDKTSNKILKGFQNGVNSLKKFGLSLFGIQSMYRLVSRASSAYLSQDTELAQKLQSVWVGLGSFLAPTIEYISNLLLKGLGYLNEFIKALTGVDHIARANAKSLDKQAQAQKNLNNQTYDFDVIRKEQDTSSSSGGISSSGLIQIPELDENVVNKLKDLAYWLKDNKKWIEAVGIALGVTFGAITIKNLLGSIGALIGTSGAAGAAGAGLLGLQALLVGIAGAYVIYMYIENTKKIINELNEVKDAYSDLSKQADNYSNSTGEISNKFRELMETGDLTQEHIDGWQKTLKLTTDTVVDQYKELENNKTWWGEFTGMNDEIRKSQENLVKSLEIVTEDYKLLYNQGLLNDEQTKDYKEHLLEQIKVMEDLGYDTNNLKEEYQKLTGQNYNLEFKATIKDETAGPLKTIMNNIKRGLSDAWNGIFGSGTSKKFAQGGIVTQPTRALIGEAGYPEAVIPLTDDYLSTLASLIGQYGSGSGSNTTNVYLNGRLIQREISKQSEQISFATNK